jgi:hypothetical protein
MTWIKRITPVLIVDEIEPCIAFWEAIGFDRGPEVPHGDKLGFIILEKAGLEIMSQTRASVAEDVAALANTPMKGNHLFIEVMDLEAVIDAIGNAPVIFPRRKTFYGMDEIGVREPGGNAVTFAMAVSGDG